VMIFISFAEFLRTSITNIGFFYANIGFFIGVVSIFLLDSLIPHVYKEEKSGNKNILEKEKRSCKLKKTCILLTLGITIHNFPEGIAVLFSTLSDINLGIMVAIAIAIHNIPEGISISVPIYYATKNKGKAFLYSFLSGIAEPIGAVLALLVLYPFISQFILNFMFAVVAGIMVFISFDELLPTCFKYKESHLSILGLFIGMFVMSLGLYISG